MTEALALAVVARALAQVPTAAERLTGGQANTVFAVTCDGGDRVVVRFHPRNDGFAGTQHTIATLAALGLPVPTVLAAGQETACSWLILSWTPGVELRWALGGLAEPEKEHLAAQIVGFQRQVGGLPTGIGFGYVPPGSPGTHPTWRALLDHHAHLPEAPADLLAYLETVPPTCFLDDITGKNVLIANGKLTGLIDLDYVCYGDPLYWLALTWVGMVCDLAGDSYVGALVGHWNPSLFEQRVLALYCALMADDFLTWFTTTESGTWAERMTMARMQWWDAACNGYNEAWDTVLSRSWPSPA